MAASSAPASEGGKTMATERAGNWKIPSFWTLTVLVALLSVFLTIGNPWKALLSSKTAPFLANQTDTCACQVPKLSGIVDDCCCDYETVDELNRDVLHPILNDLVVKPFFRYFKVRLWCDCPFWPDDGMCFQKDCSVCECTEDELPEPFRRIVKHRHPEPDRPNSNLKPEVNSASDTDSKDIQSGSLLPSDSIQCQEGTELSDVDRTLNENEFRGWSEVDNPWTSDDESDKEGFTYVNLLLNPERYTGYKGMSARRVWDAVYMQSCFKDGVEDTCTERRVLYRLISGLHTSINIHVASNFLVDEEKKIWGPNLEMFRTRIAAFPQRLQNLYFVFLFVLRAVTKAGPYLSHAEYDTGNVQEDKATMILMRQLINNRRLFSACPVPFDEAKLWKGEEGPSLKKQLQNHFRNISSIMDCVGCEKCRLWGKLQILGLGTALKILFSVDGGEEQGNVNHLELQRNEVSALINLLARLSDALSSTNELMQQLQMNSTLIEKKVT